MFLTPSVPQGIRHSFTQLLLGFSLLLQCSATANASVFVFWLPVDSPTRSEDEPLSATPQFPALNVVFPGAATVGPFDLRGSFEQVEIRLITDYHGNLRLADPSSLQSTKDSCQASIRASSDHRRLQAAFQQTLRWVQAIGKEDVRQFAAKEYRRDAARWFGQRALSATVEVIGSLEQDVPPWTDAMWLERGSSLANVMASGDIQWTDGQTQSQIAQFLPGAVLPKVHLPETLLPEAVLPEVDAELETARHSEPVRADALQAAAGVLRSLSEKLARLSDRLDSASHGLDFTARLAK